MIVGGLIHTSRGRAGGWGEAGGEAFRVRRMGRGEHRCTVSDALLGPAMAAVAARGAANPTAYVIRLSPRLP